MDYAKTMPMYTRVHTFLNAFIITVSDNRMLFKNDFQILDIEEI